MGFAIFTSLHKFVDFLKTNSFNKAYGKKRLEFPLVLEKISEKLVKKLWEKLFLDPETKLFLEFLLWPKKTFLP